MHCITLSRPIPATALAAIVFSMFPGCTELGTDVVFSPEDTTTTIIIVRHAERDPGLDPPPNDEGIIRAHALADELADAGVTAIFHPDFIRNAQTAAPLADLVSPTIRVYSVAEVADTKALANNFVDEVIRDHAGGVVLRIGNTGPAIENIQEGNLQEIFYRLGGTGTTPTAYVSLYTVALTDSEPLQITKGTYGGPSSLD